MCSISGSFSKSKLQELYKLNAYRGEMNFSLSTFEKVNDKTRLGIIFQDKGGLPDYLIKAQTEAPGKFFLAHSQAPTSGAANIHPAPYAGALLWHNGIIKQKALEDGLWDTQYMLSQIIDYGWSSLSRLDGSFACIMYNEDKLYAFRNEISPLYVDNDLNISSTKFDSSYPITPNFVWEFDMELKMLRNIAHFETFENPYYMEN
jgi:asparagine synthetase B (glutamine-hydrolysing)